MKVAERELGVFSSGKTGLSGDLVTMFHYLKGGYKEVADSIFIRSHMENSGGNGYKVLLGKFHLETRRKFFTMRTTRN